jgi:2-amino-4-hydroxy-6-hydroxymethyldihydropteridine diphosphokinase
LIKQVSLRGLKHMDKGIFLLLGTNEGDRSANLATARQLIADRAGEIVRFSAAYETAPWGNTDQPAFYNQVIAVDTSLDPETLLQHVLGIEHAMGRKRLIHWGQRIIDIDILLYGQQIVNSPLLTIPHPRLPDRKFALIPLDEIAPEFEHPLLKKNIRTLLLECPDTLSVQMIENHR